MEPYVASALLEAGFRQAVMASYPSETVTSLPEYSNQDPDFWDTRFLAAILHPVTFPDGAAVPPRPHPWDVTQRKTSFATLMTFTPICKCTYMKEGLRSHRRVFRDITVHEFGHSLHWLGFNRSGKF